MNEKILDFKKLKPLMRNYVIIFIERHLNYVINKVNNFAKNNILKYINITNIIIKFQEIPD